MYVGTPPEQGASMPPRRWSAAHHLSGRVRSSAGRICHRNLLLVRANANAACHSGMALPAYIWLPGCRRKPRWPTSASATAPEADLMAYRDRSWADTRPYAFGISVSNATPSTQGLPNVDPVYTWVRLAQRVPVRIKITDVPPGIPRFGYDATSDHPRCRGAEKRARSASASPASGITCRHHFTVRGRHLTRTADR